MKSAPCLVNPLMLETLLLAALTIFARRIALAGRWLGVVASSLRVNRPSAENFLMKAQNRHKCRALAVDLFVQDSIDRGLGDVKSLSKRDFAEPGGGLDLYEHFVAGLHHVFHSIPQRIAYQAENSAMCIDSFLDLYARVYSPP